jgi:hypothetical protein
MVQSVLEGGRPQFPPRSDILWRGRPWSGPRAGPGDLDRRAGQFKSWLVGPGFFDCGWLLANGVGVSLHSRFGLICLANDVI